MAQIEITLNGEKRQIADGISVANLVENLQLDTKKIAIERNGQIVLLEEFADAVVKNGDKLEIVHFIGGG
jgi:thiamine biosynthesis protein ThiS